ncbi:type 1 glutamine amidotransferase [Paraburkholderia sp. A1RI-2L]|uniref:type 1 glutamine amidotransferase domain-containing protein n=1 Tax=Paraburkholderia sp. A1RI-2L TaxID=3028367 RepID=UPI003B800045
MSNELKHCKVAILAVDGFEESELTGPLRALTEAGAQVDVISQKGGEIQGFRHLDKGNRVKVDQTFAQAKADDYDGVVLPGGVINGDAIRMIPEAREFVRAANAAHKPVAAICHGGWLAVSAGIVSGRTMTSWPSLQDDIRNAGGTWVDQRVVRDGNFVTSRKPDDLPAFNAELIACLATSAPL